MSNIKIQGYEIAALAIIGFCSAANGPALTSEEWELVARASVTLSTASSYKLSPQEIFDKIKMLMLTILRILAQVCFGTPMLPRDNQNP